MNTMPACEELSSFLHIAKDRGVADESIVALLRHNGWSERRVRGALTGYYSESLGTPVPSRGGNAENARDAFYYLLNFITLGFWTVALGQVFYTLIARWVPDAADASYYQGNLTQEISWQVATIIVAFPIFALIHGVIRRNLRLHPETYESGVRKWLTYIALVLAALVVLTDGVWFTNALLRGELTMRFILDSCVLLVLGGGIFAYYLTTMNPRESLA
jgi:hypothetical protein